MSRPIAETFPAPNQHATGDSIGPEMLNATYPLATAPRKRRTDTFADSEIATTPPKDFPGTTILCDMFGYSTEVERPKGCQAVGCRLANRGAVWT